jgi:hypothetical protein
MQSLSGARGDSLHDIYFCQNFLGADFAPELRLTFSSLFRRRDRKARNQITPVEDTANAQPNNGCTNQKRQAIPSRPATEEPMKSNFVSLSGQSFERRVGPLGTGIAANMTRNGIATLKSATLTFSVGGRTSRVTSCVKATKHAPASAALNVSIGSEKSQRKLIQRF